MAQIQINAEKIFDRGPKYGYLEVQVNFEEKSQANEDLGLAYVIILLEKAKVASMSFEEIRAAAMAKALSYMETCIQSCRNRK